MSSSDVSKKLRLGVKKGVDSFSKIVPINLVGKIYNQVINTITSGDTEPKQDLVLYVGAVYNHMLDALQKYSKVKKRRLRIGLIHDSRQKLDQYTQAAINRLDLVLSCDTNQPTAIQNMILPYQNEILALTCRSERHIPMLGRIIPNTPYVNTPTTESLRWSSDKIAMRERLATHNKTITPAFVVVDKTDKSSIKQIEEEIGYPLIVKPSGLASSVLVTICYHREELEETLGRIFKKIDGIYKKNDFLHEPKVLIEEYMEGEMYSIDAYISPHGKIFLCPMVYIKTGKKIGFDDFFGYFQITPPILNRDNTQDAQKVAHEAIIALGLRSTTAHIEMMRTEQGWKIIEAGARVGGFRHMLYEYSYGFNHTANDLAIHIPEKPVILRTIKGYTVAMKFYAKEEGKLEKLTGLKKSQELKSFKKIYINKKIGDPCLYAKHGGSSVFNIILHNEDRSKLLADVRRLEQMVDIEVK